MRRRFSRPAPPAIDSVKSQAAATLHLTRLPSLDGVSAQQIADLCRVSLKTAEYKLWQEKKRREVG